ncbi:ornithine carbamoyltransferase [Ekhidna sp.]|uniref:ornithine carbamoyltransferase n=1 Tax=Ekhidna sp. TaxID=2608089 RepID=UPI003299E88D
MKHFLEVGNLSIAEIEHVLELSTYLNKSHEETLLQTNVLFCFEKPSLRTKVGTEVAINQLGGRVIHIDPNAFLGGKIMHAKPIPGLDERESLKDTVMNVSKWCDAIFTRVFSHETLLTLCNHSEIPVINALSDEHHPMQALADFRTIQQKYNHERVPITFIGDANNVARSLIEMGIRLGYPMGFAGPANYSWTTSMLDHFDQLSKTYKGSFMLFENAQAAAMASVVVYADTFISMGEEDQHDQKLQHFHGYQVNEKLMQLCPQDASFMHCLPAHRGVEVTNQVLDAENSLIYQQAENRMIVSKGLFTFLLTEQETDPQLTFKTRYQFNQ